MVKQELDCGHVTPRGKDMEQGRPFWTMVPESHLGMVWSRPNCMSRTLKMKTILECIMSDEEARLPYVIFAYVHRRVYVVQTYVRVTSCQKKHLHEHQQGSVEERSNVKRSETSAVQLIYSLFIRLNDFLC